MGTFASQLAGQAGRTRRPAALGGNLPRVPLPVQSRTNGLLRPAHLHELRLRVQTQGLPALRRAAGRGRLIPALDRLLNAPGPESDVSRDGGRLPALHRTIVAVDIEGFGARQANPEQLAVRDGLYRCLRESLARSEIPWDVCYHEDRGDGVVFLIPAEIPKEFLVARFLAEFCAALRRHNEATEGKGKIRVRLVMHAGEVHRDAYGVAGTAVNVAFRLLEAEPLKQALASSHGALAVIVSPWFFDGVIRHVPAGEPASYRQVPVSVKETQTLAWICRPDDPYSASESAAPARLGDHRRDAGRAKGPSLSEMADQLAVAIGTQWEQEAGVRRLNDPYPLPVSWASADTSLADDWEALVRLASTGAGWPASPPGAWAAGPDSLVGAGGDLAEVLARVPTGRLVVLGEPGAGKTMLMVRLVLDLLARRVPGAPVPVLVSLASWNPRTEDLRRWLGAQLATDHPALAAKRLPGLQEGTSIDALLKAGLILPILDGLDEIPGDIRGPALTRISDMLPAKQHIIVTCRTEQYRELMSTRGPRPTLRAAAIQLHPLDAGTISRYLLDDAGDLAAGARWKPVLDVLATAAPVACALTKPLMISLARAIYNPRPGEHVEELRDPAELCDPALASQADVEALLFDAFISAAYRSPTPSRGHPRWSAEQAQEWLTFLAACLEGDVKTPDLAWWQLSGSMNRLAGGLAVGSASFVMFGLAGWIAGGQSYGTGYGLAYGLAFGLAGGLSFGFGSPRPLSRVEFRFRGSALRFLALFAVGVVLGVVLAFATGQTADLFGGIAVGGALGAYGWLNTPALGKTIPSPSGTLAQDRLGTLGFGIAVALALGSLGGVDVGGLTSTNVSRPGQIGASMVVCAITGMSFGHIGYGRVAAVTYGMAGGVVGLLATAWQVPVGGFGPGLAFGLTFGLSAGLMAATPKAWCRFVMYRVFLASRGRQPWRLMSFLDDAHRRGVLRQAGAVYQFRHIELQQRLAIRPGEQAIQPETACSCGVEHVRRRTCSTTPGVGYRIADSAQ
jgi:class 3 adenylate cyclase